MLRHARSAVLLELSDDWSEPLSDRKRFLAVLAATARCGGLGGVDIWARRFWSRDALAEELACSADVDVTAVYKVDVVGDEQAGWLHTHGLAVEGRVEERTDRFALASPDGDVALVPVAEFMRRGLAEHVALRGDTTDDSHNVDRAVVCEVRADGARRRNRW
jgi:hypothetical protein